MVLVVEQELKVLVRARLEVDQVDLSAATEALGEDGLVPSRAGLPQQSPHARWAAADESLGDPARDALAVSGDDACLEGPGLAVTAVEVYLEQVIEDATTVRDHLGSVECQRVSVAVVLVLEDEDLGRPQGDELVLLCPRVHLGVGLLHLLLSRVPCSGGGFDSWLLRGSVEANWTPSG